MCGNNPSSEASSLSQMRSEEIQPSAAHEEETFPDAAIMPVVLVLDHLRSAFNVGNIFRLAEATRIEKIITVGYTATPPHPKLAKTARGCEERVPCEKTNTIVETVDNLTEQGYAVYAVETSSDSTVLWDCPLTFPAAFLLGNEALGITPAVLARCTACVKLPCFGIKNSVNVANCAAVVLYEAVRQKRLSRE